MKIKLSLSILTMLTITLIFYHNEQPIQRNFLSQSQKESIDKIKITEKKDSKKFADRMLKETEEDSYQKLYILLNDEKFYQKLVENPKAGIESEIEKTQKINLDVFEKNEYISDIFNDSLVHKLQEILYTYCVNDIEDAEFYINSLLNDLESGQYELSEEESAAIFQKETEYYDKIFRFFIEENREAYLFRFDMGGEEEEYYLTLKVNNGKELSEIASFGTPHHDAGKVIKYQNNYYYVFFENNYNLKCNDGIRIYKLNENAKEENILIRYIPNEYTWENLYSTNDRQVKEYVENVQDMITSEEYIERGAKNNYYNMMVGDEKEDIEFPLTEEYKKYYKVDFTNTGIPIYIYRTTYEPSNAYKKICLKFTFYLWDRGKKEILELDALNFSNEGNKTANGLVQMWFKEFNGKIYTFQIYSMDNFRYMLNVFLVEGDKITPIRVDYLLPKRMIVVE